MLLTLSVNSLSDRLTGRHPKMTLFEVPAFTLNEFSIHGLCLQTHFLKGWDINAIDKLRDEADRAGCPWLTLVEDDAHDLASDKKADEAIKRMERVLRVGQRLGCASVAMSVKANADADVEAIAARLKKIVTAAERLEINLLLAPRPGLTETPEQLTGMIRQVGGFRIGSMPDFEVASNASDTDAYLRALTPYASAVYGAVAGFDVQPCVEAIKSVGYEGALALEYRLKDPPIEEGLPPVVESIAGILEAEA
jgi:hypothetical protein